MGKITTREEIRRELLGILERATADELNIILQYAKIITA